MTSASAPAYVAQVAWADQSCGSIGQPFFDLSILPINWDNPGRTEPLLWLIREFGKSGSTWSGVIDHSGGRDKIRDYAQSSKKKCTPTYACATPSSGSAQRRA